MSAMPGPSSSRPWTESPDELALLDQSRAVFRALADLLHAVDDARYAEPAGGFDPTK